MARRWPAADNHRKGHGLAESAHGGNTREAAALLGIAPGELLDLAPTLIRWGCPPRSGRRSLTTRAAPNATLTSSINSCIRRWLPTISAGGAFLAGNGETESIFTLVHGLKPRRAMIVIPGFAEYRRALQTVDCEVVEYALRERDGWQLTDAILDALTPALDCLFLCTRTTHRPAAGALLKPLRSAAGR